MGKLVFFIALVNCAVFYNNCLAQVSEQNASNETNLTVVPLAKTNVEETALNENEDDYVNDSVDDYKVVQETTDEESYDDSGKENKVWRFGNFSGRVVTRIINVTLGLDEYTTVTSEEHPKPYPTDKDTIYEWFIGLGDGYGVEMIIRTMDLAPDDYLQIRPGGVEKQTERQIVFSSKLNKERKYKLFHLDDMYMAFVVKARSDNTHIGFQIDFKNVGIPVTTEPPTTTEEAPVTVAPLNESTIYLGGRTQEDFLNISTEFQLQLAHMAEVYCNDNNITVDSNITITDNVNYHLITQCTLEWPKSETCVRIVYSIGVSYNTETEEYELSAAHLEDMWLNYRHLLNLTDLDLYVYTPPNDDEVLMVWIIVSTVTLLVFIIMIAITSRYNCFYEQKMPRSLRTSLISHRTTNDSLFPTPHQTVPPFYGMDYYTPEDDQFWSKDDNIPPKYSGGMSGERNNGFIPDDETLDLYSEEIVMSLPDGRDSGNFSNMKSTRDEFEPEVRGKPTSISLYRESNPHEIYVRNDSTI